MKLIGNYGYVMHHDKMEKIGLLIFYLQFFWLARISTRYVRYHQKRNTENSQNYIQVGQPLQYRLMIPLSSNLRLDAVDPAFAVNGNVTIASTNSEKPSFVLNSNLAVPPFRTPSGVDTPEYHFNDLSKSYGDPVSPSLTSNVLKSAFVVNGNVAAPDTVALSSSELIPGSRSHDSLKPFLAPYRVHGSASTGSPVNSAFVLNGNVAIPGTFGLAGSVDTAGSSLHDSLKPPLAAYLVHESPLTSNTVKTELVMNGNIAMPDSLEFQTPIITKPSPQHQNRVYINPTSSAEKSAFGFNGNLGTPALKSVVSVDPSDYHLHDMNAPLALNGEHSSSNKAVSLHCSHSSPDEVTCSNGNFKNNVRCIIKTGNGTVSDSSVARLVGLVYQKVVTHPGNKTMCFFLPPPATTLCPTPDPCDASNASCPISTTTEDPFASCKTTTGYRETIITCDPLNWSNDRTMFLCNWEHEEQGLFSIATLNTAGNIKPMPCWTVSWNQ